MPDHLARELGRTTTPSLAYTGWAADPPPGVHVHVADTYGRPLDLARSGDVVTLTLPGGGAREFGPRARGVLLRALMGAAWDAEAEEAGRG